MTDPLLFLVAIATLLMAPGPTNALLAASGAALGFRRSLPLLAAVVLAYLIAVGVIRVVVGPVVAALPALAMGLKVAVSIYLAWLALRLWLRALPGQAAPPSWGEVFTATLLNPKSLIFAIGILPEGGWETLWYVATFCFVSVGAGLGWIGVGLGVGRATRGRDARLVPRIAAVALGGFAGVILVSAFG